MLRVLSIGQGVVLAARAAERSAAPQLLHHWRCRVLRLSRLYSYNDDVFVRLGTMVPHIEL